MITSKSVLLHSLQSNTVNSPSVGSLVRLLFGTRKSLGTGGCHGVFIVMILIIIPGHPRTPLSTSTQHRTWGHRILQSLNFLVFSFYGPCAQFAYNGPNKVVLE